MPSSKGCWRLRAACYQRIPGLVRFSDEDGLRQVVEAGGLTVLETRTDPGRVTALAQI